MALYSVNYDLRKPGRDYSDLYDLLESYPRWARVLDSFWLIRTTETAVTVRDKIGRVVDENDQYVVATASAPAAWYGLSADLGKWLKDEL